MQPNQCKALVVNATEFFRDQEFVSWLNNDEPKFTWHVKGAQPAEYSDVVVMVDPSLNGEGSESNMPAHIWYRIVEMCKAEFGQLPKGEHHIMVRLTNLD